MFCSFCGKKIDDGAKFCPFCGKSLAENVSESNRNLSSSGSVTINNWYDNKNISIVEQKGCFTIYQHEKDLSVSPMYAVEAYYMSQMNVKKRQVLCELNGNSIKMQAGAMQWMSGNVEMNSDVKGIGGLLGGIVKGAVTGESAVKPIYSGKGLVMLEPTYNYLLIEDVESWGAGVVLDDGLFLACDATLTESINKRSNFTTALLGGVGLYNLCLSGKGQVVLESPVPREELIEFELNDSVVKIDGNMAIAWSSSLSFTVEKVTKSSLGSFASGEGLVNVYRGTGKILMAPTMNGTVHTNTNGPVRTEANSSQGILSTLLNS